MNQQEAEPIRIWVELDVLLDTRLSTLYSLSPDLLPTCLKNDYHKRPMDDWEALTEGTLTNADFWEAYSQRNKETLKEALPTKLTAWLGQLCRDLSKRSMYDPVINDIIVEVGLFPYEFTLEERKVLCAMVGHYVGEGVAVKTSNKKVKDLTPSRLKEDYAAFILYSFDDWFTLHKDELETVICPRVTAFAPALFINRVPDPEELDQALEEYATQNPFRLLEIALIERLHLQYMDVDFVSALQ